MPRHGFRVRGNFILKEFSKRTSFIREETALKRLQPHPFITELNESYMTEACSKFVGVLTLRYYRGCDLHDWIERRRNGASILFVRYVFKKVLLAYDYAAKHNIYHRDLKPENIMIDEVGMVKLIDWELCSFNQFSSRRVGTPEYMSQEVHNGELYECLKSDIWSLAVVMFCLATGRRPYESITRSDPTDDEWVEAIYNKEWRKFWKSHQQCTKFPTLPVSFKYCIENMLKEEPNDRASLDEIMTSTFFIGEEMEPKEIINTMEYYAIYNPLV